MTVDVYEQYLAGKCVYAGVLRRGVSVKLTCDSEAGEIAYTVSVSFFPHTDDEDFAVSYDAYAETEIYRAAGRRSKKREAAFLTDLRERADALAVSLGGTIDWDVPLTAARLG